MFCGFYLLLFYNNTIYCLLQNRKYIYYNSYKYLETQESIIKCII